VSREVTDASWADDAHTASTAEDRIVAEMGPFENYIIGLLTNCGSLPLDRLHNMLRVFVVGEPKYEGRSQEQLGAFLAIMAGHSKIEANNGVYSRPKPQQG
jgi:anaphase-promoting complex subunit 2